MFFSLNVRAFAYRSFDRRPQYSIKDLTRCMLVLADSSLPEPYWEKAIFLGCHLRGIMVPNSTKDGGWYYHVHK